MKNYKKLKQEKYKGFIINVYKDKNINNKYPIIVTSNVKTNNGVFIIGGDNYKTKKNAVESIKKSIDNIINNK